MQGLGKAGVIESLGLEKTTKITQSKRQPTPPMPTDHIPQCHIHTALEQLQGSDSTTSLGSLCYCLTILYEKIFFLKSHTGLSKSADLFILFLKFSTHVYPGSWQIRFVLSNVLLIAFSCKAPNAQCR